MNKRITVAALALAAIGLASTYASAQNVAVGSNDLILGFEVTDGAGQGSTTDLEVDLGATSLFTSSQMTESLNQLVSADLTATYGAGWATRTDLTWGAAGTSASSATTFLVTDSATNPKVSPSQTATVNGIAAMSTLLGSSAQTANSTSASNIGNGTQSAANTPGSFTAAQNSGNGNDFGQITPDNATDVNAGSGNPLGSINLYNFPAGSATTKASLLGSLSLTDAGGNLLFTYTGAQAVPEPSAYALGICAILLFLVLKRRHSVA